MTYEAFRKFVTDGKRGERIVYHTGNLAADRSPEGSPLRRGYDTIGILAYSARCAGKVALVQRRIKALNSVGFDYVAIHT